MKLVCARGLHWASRVHLIQGIMSYLASPLWLLLLVAGFVLAVVAQYTEPNYFPEGFSLFPVWPVFDPDRALELFVFTAVVLYLPKLFGIILALRDKRLRKGCGGAIGLLRSLGVEVVLSALLVADHDADPVALRGGRFPGPRFGLERADARRCRRDASPRRCARHWLHTLVGIAAGVLAFSISWTTFAVVLADRGRARFCRSRSHG